MSLLKQVKGVLKTKNVSELVIEFEDGSTQEHSLEEGGKSELKSFLRSIDWEEVAEVQFVVDEEEEEDDEDDEDDDEDDDDEDEDDEDYDDEDEDYDDEDED
ncbi:hypothetical protein ACX93W_23030 [Paenibacillus sp. CAU 1782]